MVCFRDMFGFFCQSLLLLDFLFVCFCVLNIDKQIAYFFTLLWLKLLLLGF